MKLRRYKKLSQRRKMKRKRRIIGNEAKVRK
jgi:hypothetical protein